MSELEPCRVMTDRTCHYIPQRTGTNEQGEPTYAQICAYCGKILPPIPPDQFELEAELARQELEEAVARFNVTYAELLERSKRYPRVDQAN
jgi:hypothetical protein